MNDFLPRLTIAVFTAIASTILSFVIKDRQAARRQRLLELIKIRDSLGGVGLNLVIDDLYRKLRYKEQKYKDHLATIWLWTLALAAALIAVVDIILGLLKAEEGHIVLAQNATPFLLATIGLAFSILYLRTMRTSGELEILRELTQLVRSPSRKSRSQKTTTPSAINHPDDTQRGDLDQAR